MKERLDELIIKYWAGTLTPTEQEEMERLLVAYPEEWIKMGLLHQTNIELQPALSEEDSEAIVSRILRQEKTAPDKRKELRGKKTFAFLRKSGKPVLLFMTLVLLAFLGKKALSPGREHTDWQQVRTIDGMKTTLRLADGTEVWLNAGSSLRYPEAFHQNTREVYLVGEAYFKVKHESGRPFVIHTAQMDAKVLGTELDVRAYPDEKFSETSLISGAVKVILKHKKHSQGFYLKPRQKIIFRQDPRQQDNENELKPLSDKAVDSLSRVISSDIVLKPIKKIDENTIPETAWKQNVLIYENEPLNVLAKRLSRWYGVNITIKDSALAKQRFTGRADNISLEKLLHILQMLKPFTYTIENHQVIIQ